MITEPFGIANGTKTFWQKNIGEPVNLYTQSTTYSGDLESYDSPQGLIELKNYIMRRYKEDGSSEFIECQDVLEVESSIVKVKEKTTREDRLGRIAKYNQDLKFEELERQDKLRKLETQLQDQPTQDHS